MPDFLEQMVRELAQMSVQQENLQIISQETEAMKSRDSVKMASLLDDTFVMISDTLPTPEKRTDSQGYLQLCQAMWKALPDADYVLEEEPIANGDYVTTLWWVTGTHQGTFIGIPATGRRIDFRGQSVYKIKSGKITVQWDYWDTGIILRQMGVIPQQPSTGAIQGGPGPSSWETGTSGPSTGTAAGTSVPSTGTAAGGQPIDPLLARNTLRLIEELSAALTQLAQGATSPEKGGTAQSGPGT